MRGQPCVCSLIESTIWERLRVLGLTGMADEAMWQQQSPSLAPLTFEELLGLLVDAEWIECENRQLTGRLRKPGCASRPRLKALACMRP